MKSTDRKFVHSLDDIPHVECWVIVQGTSIHVPGDERSRTNPGHGYPEHTDHYVTVYEVFTDEGAFKEELARETRFSNPVRGFKFTPYSIKTTVEVVPSGN